MAKTHEKNLNTSAFNQFTNNDYIIMEVGDIKVDDFILFKQTETIDGEVTETGLYRMTQVKQIIKNEGLKEGYALLILNKL